MITNKDISIENGNIILNGDKYPLDGQSPETIMGIVKDNSDTTPTENSTAPITSGGVFTADKAITDTIGDITQTGLTGDSVAAQLGDVNNKVNIVSNISPGPNITMLSGVYVKIGTLVSVNLVCRATDALAPDSVICNAPASSMANAPLNVFVGSQLVSGSNCRIYNGAVRVGTNISSGTEFCVQGSYISTT